MTVERDFHDDAWFTVDIVLPRARWLQFESLIRAEGGRATVLSVNPVPADPDAEPVLRRESDCPSCASPREPIPDAPGGWVCGREGCRDS